VWVDFKIIEQFNWRAPGIDLIPMGYINEHHEPTQFYSVLRPELYNGLIPSTWKAPATSIYGTIAEGLTYTIQASSSLEDFGDDFGTRTDANTVPPYPAGYVAGIDGLSALGFSLPVRGDFKQLNDDIAVAAQLAYSPPMLPGFAGSTSAYYTPADRAEGDMAEGHQRRSVRGAVGFAARRCGLLFLMRGRRRECPAQRGSMERGAKGHVGLDALEPACGRNDSGGIAGVCGRLYEPGRCTEGCVPRSDAVRRL
jgi:hypothetical protein